MGALFGGKSSSEKQLGGQFQDVLPKLEGVGDTAAFQGKKNLKQGGRDLNLVGDFFKQLLTGDRTTVGQVLAPEIQAVMSQYDATKRNLGEYGPRGGGQVAALGSLAQQEAGQVGSLYSGARQRGAQGLEGIGQSLGQLGLGASGLGAQSFGQMLQSILGEQGLEAGITQRKQDALGGVGSLVGGLAGLFL